jgi:dihydrofolate reductase
MRQLIARVFTYALDGVANAEEGSEYMEFCQRLWAADQSVLDPTAELYQRAHALIMGRVAYLNMRAHFAPGGSATGHPWTGIFNTAPKVVFSRTLKTADWANTTIAAGDTAAEIDKLRQGGGGHIVVCGGFSFWQSLMRLDLIDVFYLSLTPYVAGEGKRLFEKRRQVRAARPGLQHAAQQRGDRAGVPAAPLKPAAR